MNTCTLKTIKEVTNNLKYGDYESTITNDDTEIYNAENSNSAQYPSKVKLIQFIFTTFIVFISPNICFTQLPNLGTAVNFALFTTFGALDNTGTSDITGDIGTNDGATAGFGAPTVVNGNTESTNAVTTQCAIDVQAAYDELFATTPTVINHTPAFGSGEILPPGVYAIAAAGSVGGTLTLDAGGDADAVFIFQFGGAFTTGASSTINLINGATSCNVFWIAEGAIAMGALTDMKGTLIANNGAISMGTDGILDGRMLSTAGAATVYNTLITLPDCLLLPISLLSFTGTCNKQNIELHWRTASETDNDFFTVERSADGENWHVAGTVDGATTSSSPLDYVLTDINPHQVKSYYRLKQTDFNGDNKYLALINITTCEDEGINEFTIYPNPTAGKFELLFNGHTSNIDSIHIYNTQGQNVYSSIGFESTIDLSNNVSGPYYIVVQQNSEILRLKFILYN